MESTEALCIGKNEKNTVPKPVPHVEHKDDFFFFFLFLCNSQTVLSRCCSAWEPPVESTHWHCGAARCPRCWNVCARLRAGLMLQWVFPPGGPLSSNIFTPSNSNKLQRSWAAFYYRENGLYLRASLPVANINHFSATTNLVWLCVTNQRMTCFVLFFSFCELMLK